MKFAILNLRNISEDGRQKMKDGVLWVNITANSRLRFSEYKQQKYLKTESHETQRKQHQIISK